MYFPILGTIKLKMSNQDIEEESKSFFQKAIDTHIKDKIFFIGPSSVKEYRRATLNSLYMLTDTDLVDLQIKNIV